MAAERVPEPLTSVGTSLITCINSVFNLLAHTQRMQASVASHYTHLFGSGLVELHGLLCSQQLLAE